jgi:hypothetical protein
MGDATVLVKLFIEHFVLHPADVRYLDNLNPNYNYLFDKKSKTFLFRNAFFTLKTVKKSKKIYIKVKYSEENLKNSEKKYLLKLSFCRIWRQN